MRGTLNGLDGEMIALDGRFYRAALDGAVDEIAAEECTPFAVVTCFSPTVEAKLREPLGHEALLAEVDALIPDGTASCAIRVEGRFEHLRLRSVPRQQPPYRPLAEIAQQRR